MDKCPSCGVALDEKAKQAGRCSACGTELEAPNAMNRDQADEGEEEEIQP